MRRYHPFGFPVALLILISAPALQGQVVATGVVLDASTQLPLPGVEVVIEGHNRTVFTDSLGRYRLDRVPDGPRVVLFRLVGYRPVRTMASFKRGETTVVDGLMIGLAVQLDSVLVRGLAGRARGVGFGLEAFEERRSKGFGIFLDSTLLRRNEHRDLADVVRSHPGISISDRQRGGGYYIAAGRGPSRCLVQMYLDGMRLPVPTKTNIVSVSDLLAVEVYRSAAEVPLEYGGPRSACGVVLMWTKRGR